MADSTASRITVSLVYALVDQSWQVTVELADGSTVAEAIAASGLHDAFPELADTEQHQVGIHGRLCSSSHRLSEGERIEILRPLQYDPLESRRRRAQHRRRLIQKDTGVGSQRQG